MQRRRVAWTDGWFYAGVGLVWVSLQIWVFEVASAFGNLLLLLLVVILIVVVDPYTFTNK